MEDELPYDTEALETLTIAQAALLAARAGDLSLDGLTEISDEVAEILSHHVGGSLSLNNITTLSETAAALARHEGDVDLQALTRLTSEALAAKLAISTDLWNLAEITPEAARVVVAADSPWSMFDGLEDLSVETAAAFAHSRSTLSFGGLRALSDDVATALVPHEGCLCLGGLAALSVDTARILAQHKGPLKLDGLVSLDDEVVEVLSRHVGELGLDGVTNLSVTAACALAAHAGPISLGGLHTLSTAAAKALASHDDLLSLNGMATIADDTARELAKHAGGLSLGGLATLSDAVAQSLSRFRGWVLILDGLRSLSPKHAAMLARHKAGGAYDSGLSLGESKGMSAEVAAGLAPFHGRLFLDGLEELSDSAAAHLATHQGGLWMQGLTTLSAAAAEVLGKGGELHVDTSRWPDSAAARYRQSLEHAAEATEEDFPGPVQRVSPDSAAAATDETALRSALVLRDLIEAAPSVLRPVGHYSVVLSGHKAVSRTTFLDPSWFPEDFRSDVQYAVGDYLASLPLPDAPGFAAGAEGPADPNALRITLRLDGCPAAIFLDGISPDTLRRLYAAAAPATFGDMTRMETRVDPLVRSGREIGAEHFTVSRALIAWVEKTWANRFQPEAVRIEPHKINLYAPGDRFAMHRDTPERNLVGTFLLALGGWGPACCGGGLVVHDEVGTVRWGGASGWAAFLPYLPHEVEPITSGARVILAFKVFAASDAQNVEDSPFDDALLEEAANRIALCRNQRGQVGVLLKYSYSLGGTALCGTDRFIHRALDRLGVVESIPVAVQVRGKADADDQWQWHATANVYGLTTDNLATIARTAGRSSHAHPMNADGIPFIAVAAGHEVFEKGHNPIERLGNDAAAANIDNLYVHRALIVTEPNGRTTPPIRCPAADLAKVDLSGCDLPLADLQSANLAYASLARGRLGGAFLASADLSHATLAGADLSGADLACADLTNADLSGACLRDASLKGACLEGVGWDAGTIWPEGFDPVNHGAPPIRAEPPSAEPGDTAGT
jgi:hypothetical protein